MTDQRTTNGVVKQTISQSNLDGSLATMTYPSGRTITYATSGAERLLSAQDTANSINYATSALYSPSGSLRSLMNGTNLLSSLYYNSRMQPCRMAVNSSGTAPGSCTDSATGNVLDVTYNFNLGSSDNGNVMGIANNRDTTRSQAFTYDGLNRLATMAAPGDTCTGLSWTYDAWGNRTDQNYTGGTCGTFHATVGTNNRLTTSGYTYDAAGNMTSDGSHTYFYDAENHLIQVGGTLGRCSTATACYIYDAGGSRVEKTVGGTARDFLYGAGSNVLAEVTNGTWQAGYVYFNGQLLAEYQYGTTYFIHKDHLGSTRLMTRMSQTIYDSFDYLPFGESITGAGGTSHLFTDQERDSESNLDNFLARYDSSAMGRFMSPDPLGGSLMDPQSLNKYSYVRNNPLNLTDPTGMSICDTLGSEDCMVGMYHCQMDGQPMSCGVVLGAIHGGAAAQCPNNNCNGFSAGADGMAHLQIWMDPTRISTVNSPDDSIVSREPGYWATVTYRLPWNDLPIDMDIWHNSAQCPGCGNLWNSTSEAMNQITAGMRLFGEGLLQ